jgi:RNA polymerase sigma-70 factor (ECF subfamily)
MTMDPEELRLVVRASEGDPAAFGELVRIHWVRLVRLAKSMVGDTVAEDVVQEALLVGWHTLGRLGKPESFGAWVTRIVFRRCLRVGRRHPFESAGESTADRGTTSSPETDLWVEQLLAALAPRQRAVMYLTVVEGYTDTEISRLLGIHAASVRSHRRRARQRLAVLLGNVERPQP